MPNSKFYTLGKKIYSLRWYIIGIWIIALLSCIPFISHLITPFQTSGFIDEHSQSTKTQLKMNKTLGYNNQNQIMIMYHSKNLVATSPAFIKKLKKSVLGLKHLSIQHEIIFPENNKSQISKDKHTAYIVVIFKKMVPLNHQQITAIKSHILTPSNMTMLFGGEPIFVEEVTKQTQKDLYKADFIATPVAIITLLLVFGSLMASILPVLLGGSCALLILTGLYFLGHVFLLSIFTINIALLLGLCLCLDYSLLMISRFRDELHNHSSIAEVIAVTLATAGKAIFFSAIAVFVSLGALLIFPVNILFSVAVGGLTAVFVAMLMAIIVLPAFFAVLKTRIDWIPITIFRKNNTSTFHFWRGLATYIVHRPKRFCIVVFVFLLMLGYPFISAKFGISDFRIFPEHSKNREFFDTYSKQFSEKDLSPILIVVQTSGKPVLSHDNLSKLYHLVHRLKSKAAVSRVNSIITTTPTLTLPQYDKLYHLPKHLMTAEVKQLLTTTTRDYLTIISVISKYAKNSAKTTALIHDLEKIKPGRGMRLGFTGSPVSDQDVLTSISHQLPYALLWIFVSTYFIMLILLRSLVLPIKAILMNLLSLSAAYGALVLVFQDGHLHELLKFEPQGMLDISLLVIIFCALFGFSMDYEVFLLTRIKETYDLTHDNDKSIIFGIEKSSRIITSAAMIVIVTCCSFLVAEVLMVKAFGLGIAVAIFVDAFLIRTLLVPSTMALMQKWNWYLPKWLDKILPSS